MRIIIVEVIPKRLSREGDTHSKAFDPLKLPPVAPPRSLPRVAISDGKPCQRSGTICCSIPGKCEQGGSVETLFWSSSFTLMRLVPDPACLWDDLFSWACPHAVDRGGYRHWGWGWRGGGLPLPCLQLAKIRTPHRPHPARPPASSPAPRGGGSHGDTRWKAVPWIAAIWNKQVGFNKANKSAL